MSDLKLDTGVDRDLVVENGDLVLVTETDAVAQSCEQRLKTIFGEYFLDLREGVPHFEQILKKSPEPTIIDNVLKRAILGTNGILQITEFDPDIDSARKFTLFFKALSKAGVIDFSRRKGGITLT